MNSAITATRQTIEVGWLLLQASMRSLRGHWALAIFSLVAAFTVWLVIQDVENPRTEGIVPPETEQRIEVEFVNSSEDVIVVDAAFVRVRVEAREDRLEELRASDFRATVDLQGLAAGAEVLLPVSVRSTDGDVRVLEVIPAQVPVQLEPVERAEFPVTIRQTAPLPDGYRVAQTTISPQFVTVTGPGELVDNVASVEVDVNFSGQFADFEVTRELVARNSNGQRQLVGLSQAQATVTIDVEQIVQSREFPVATALQGQLAPGYRVAAISVEPRIIQVTGSEEVLDSITELLLEPMDVAGASNDITRTVRIRPIANTILAREGVSVTVDIEPIVCADDPSESPCASSLFLLQPEFNDLPAGLRVEDGIFQVRVEVSASPLALSTLNLNDIRVVVSLAGTSVGLQTITPSVTAPTGVRATVLSQVTVNLLPQ